MVPDEIAKEFPNEIKAAQAMMELSGAQVQVMEAIFSFVDAMNNGNLSIKDLVEVIDLATDKNLKPPIIEFEMVLFAIEKVNKMRQDRSNA